MVTFFAAFTASASFGAAEEKLVDNAGQKIGPWSVTAGSVDLVNAVWQNAEGAQSIDLAGLTPGTITQTVVLTHSGKYTLKFQFAGNTAGAPAIKHMKVTAKAPKWASTLSVSKSFSTTGKSFSSMGWQTGTLTFTAKAGDAVKITFHDTDSATAYGMALDNITLTN